MRRQLMGASEVLPVYRLVDAVLQSQPFGQLHPRHRLEALQDLFLRHAAFGDAGIAVIPISFGKDRIGLNSLPEAEVVQWCEPFHDIVNVFKDQHTDSLSKTAPAMQIWKR